MPGKERIYNFFFASGPFSWRRDAYFLGGLALILIAYTWPLYRGLNAIYLEDSYLQFASIVEFSRLAMLQWGQFGLWSPYFGGGYPFYTHPLDISMSPIFYLFILPLGTSAGIVVMETFTFVVGGGGMYCLVRVLGFSPVGAFFAASVITLNGFFAYQINTGIVQSPFMLFYTWYFLFWELGRKDSRYYLGAAAIVGLNVLNGKCLMLPPFILLAFLLFIFSLSYRLTSKRQFNRKLVRNFVLVVLLGTALAAPKLLPVLELITVQPRSIDNYQSALVGAFNYRLLWQSLTSPGPFTVQHSFSDPLPDGLGVGAAIYCGYIPLAMLIVSAFFFRRRIAKYLLMSLVFADISLGASAPIDLFKWLWRLPTFHSLYNPARYFCVPIIVGIALGAAAVFQGLEPANLHRYKKAASPKTRSGAINWNRRWVAAILVSALAFWAISDMWMTGRRYFKDMATEFIPLPKVPRQQEFFSVAYPRSRLNETFFLDRPARRELESLFLSPQAFAAAGDWLMMRIHEINAGQQYFLMRQNIGLLTWFGDLDLPVYTVPRYFIARVKGDGWLYFSPDREIPWEKIAQGEKLKQIRKFSSEIIEKWASSPTSVYLWLEDEGYLWPYGIKANPEYRGEVWTDSVGGKVQLTHFSPNRLRIKAASLQPLQVVVNQNYHSAWRTNLGQVINRKGLLAVALPAGRHEIELFFRPLSFYLGLTAAGLALIFIGLRLYRFRK